jgi:beta-glucosidase
VPAPASGSNAARSPRATRVAALDHRAQEDALQLRWQAPAVLSLQAPQPLDLERQANGDVALLLTLRVDAAPEASLRVALGCAQGCSDGVDLRSTLATLPGGQWRRVGVPLKCLRARDAVLSAVAAPLRLSSAGAATLSLSGVALGTDADLVVDCERR